MNQIFPDWSCYAYLHSASWAMKMTREQKTAGNCWILSWKWRVAFDVWCWGLDLPALKRVEFGNNDSLVYFGIVELRSEWTAMQLGVDIAAFECDSWPVHLLINAWNVTVESTIISTPSRIDAPGWSEHISKWNSHRCLSCLQSFNPQMIAATVQTLVCPPYCGKDVDMRELSFTLYPNLQSIHISSLCRTLK